MQVSCVTSDDRNPVAVIRLHNGDLNRPCLRSLGGEESGANISWSVASPVLPIFPGILHPKIQILSFVLKYLAYCCGVLEALSKSHRPNVEQKSLQFVL